MSSDKTQFPDNFLWGSATAGHQVEGGNVNADIWSLEWAEQSLFVESSPSARWLGVVAAANSLD